jgi:putative lipoprotein
MSRRIGVAAAVVLAVVALPKRADASDPDPWFGRDKALHFGATATIASGGYVLGAVLFDARGYALVTGGALAAAAGIGKELLDLTGFGDPSWRDLTWDGIGTVFGLAATWGADLLIRGANERHPLFLAPRVDREGAGLRVIGTF